MCILFSYVARCVIPGEFKLIILSNRDEFFNRVSSPASFVTKTNIYATDQTFGKEGGTWLGCSKLGKIAALLNLDSSDYGKPQNDKLGRGFLVPDYLNSPVRSLNEYAEELKNEARKYNPFNLSFSSKLCLYLSDLWEVGILENHLLNFKLISAEYVSISNHIYEAPYPKTQFGEELFKKIITRYKSTAHKQQLVNKLFELAKYDKCNQSLVRKEKSATIIKDSKEDQIFVKKPGYGTRTHTIILIDDKDQVAYYESNLKLPINSDILEWQNNVIEFSLD